MTPRTDILSEQVGKLGRSFKMVGIKRNDDMPTKFVNRDIKHHWVYTYQYTDDGSCFKIEFDYFGKVFKVLK